MSADTIAEIAWRVMISIGLICWWIITVCDYARGNNGKTT